jgi:hypothetical protein
LSTYCVPDSILNAGNIAENETDEKKKKHSPPRADILLPGKARCRIIDMISMLPTVKED